jgi:hypothetical protein
MTQSGLMKPSGRFGQPLDGKILSCTPGHILKSIAFDKSVSGGNYHPKTMAMADCVIPDSETAGHKRHKVDQTGRVGTLLVSGHDAFRDIELYRRVNRNG